MTSRGAIEACLFLLSGACRTRDYGLNSAPGQGRSRADTPPRDPASAQAR